MIQQPLTDSLRQQNLTSQFYESIYDSFQNYNFRNAIFLAERLKYLSDSENNTCLLAECYLADNAPFKAYTVLKNQKSKRARFLFAVCCLKVNKLQEAEEALIFSETQVIKPGSKLNFDAVINGDQGLYLLAQISEKLQKRQQASECYLRAFQKNPTLFTALEKYIQLTENHEPLENLLANFKSNKHINLFGNTEILHHIVKSYIASSNTTPEKGNFESERHTKRLSGADLYAGNNAGPQAKNSSAKIVFRNLKMTSNDEQPSSLTSSIKKTSPSKQKKKIQAELIPNLHKTAQVNSITTSSSQTNQQLFAMPSFINNIQSQGQSSIQAPIQGVSNSGVKNPIIQSNSETIVPFQETQYSILDFLGHIALPYVKFLVQDPLESLEAFKQLKKPLDQDPWVLVNIGRCYTELSAHTEAEKFFKDAFTKEPHRTESIDFYSSCLWHLKKQAELSQLAYNCLEKQYFASETWIAMANCFSLNQDHDTAISFLNRAIQLEPLNSYAHCLLGHEFVSKENFEKAREFYQKAVNLDPRNVRAYFGLGNLCLKTEKIDMAIDYFINAVKLNGRCSTFYTQLGIAFMNKNDFSNAMEYIRKAESLCDTDKCNKYNKCQVLYRLSNYPEALKECEGLLKEVKEASIYTLLGQIQQKLNLKEQAHNSYMIASNMDRKEAQRIKNLIDSLHTGDL
jgi:anaphase-promoting complex subunit 3